MELAERFLKRSKRRLRPNEQFQPHNVPRPNLHAATNSRQGSQLIEELMSSLSLQKDLPCVSYPTPLAPPIEIDDSVVKGVDPVLKLVRDKRRFSTMFKEVCHSKEVKDLSLDDIDKLLNVSQDASIVEIHPSVFAVGRMASLDPDPNFSCHYNYYYGGNLALTNLGGLIAVIHAVHSKPGKLRVVFPHFNDGSSLENVTLVDHQMDESCVYQVDSFSDLILLRQKTNCGLFRFCHDEGTYLEKIGITTTTPSVLVSSCINRFKREEYATVSQNCAIQIYDVSGKSKRSLEIEGIKDNWGHVHYHDENVLMFSDRETISLCDLRESGSESLQWDVQSQAEICDDIFAAVKGEFLHYVCTKHYLLSLDIRRGFRQRWAHGLSDAPSLISRVPNQISDDTLLIGCQSTGGLAYVRNSPSGNISSEMLSPPLRLPSLRETLHFARTQGRLLSPVISSRFSLSLSGLASINVSGKIHILSCSGVGDLFAQSLCPKSNPSTIVEPFNGSDLNCLQHWESKCLEQYSKLDRESHASGVRSYLHVANLFNNAVGTNIDEEASSSQEMVSTAQPWNVSKNSLLKFRDFLAPKLLEHWQINEDDEWCDDDNTDRNIDQESASDSSDEQEDVESRVRKWLEGTIDKSVLETAGASKDYI